MALIWPGGNLTLSPYLTWYQDPFPLLPTALVALAYHSYPTTHKPTKPSKPTRPHHTKKPQPSRRPSSTSSKRPSKKPGTTRHTKRPSTTTRRTKRPTHHQQKTTTSKRPKPSRPHPTLDPAETTTASNSGAASFTTTKKSSDVYQLDLTWDDATWIFINSIFIFTMQSGFGLLESGCVAIKNQTNIMMKNVVDIVLGGFTYWIFGFSLTFGGDPGSNGFVGVGEYVVDSDYDIIGPVLTTFFFQLSFATTATTIVSGTMAERCNFKAYCVFSFLNTIVYCIPARWVWGNGGFLSQLGCIDIAGSGTVHLLGGTSGYVAAWILGPRMGRYDNGTDPLPLQNPTNCIIGMFILWWGWLAFNSGSTFGVTGELWKFAARAAVTTMIAPIAGGLIGSIYTVTRPAGTFEVMDIVNPILGALVGVTGGCAIYHTFDALIIGMVGGMVVLATSGFADFTRVDDPVGATSVHGFCGVWGMIAVGLFAEDDQGGGFVKGNIGLLRGGGFYLLWIQLLAAVCIIAWGALTTFILLWIINKFIPIRLEKHEEMLGADFTEHLMRRRNAGITPMLSALGSNADIDEIKKNSVIVASTYPAHETIIHALNEIRGKRKWKRMPKLASIVPTTANSSAKVYQMNTEIKSSSSTHDDAGRNGIVPMGDPATPIKRF